MTKTNSKQGIKTYCIKGRKWWDKVNGNTYNSVKIICLETSYGWTLPFAYGYGSDYFYRALDKIAEAEGCSRDELPFKFGKSIQLYDAGADYDTKRNVKNFWY